MRNQILVSHYFFIFLRKIEITDGQEYIITIYDY